MGWDEFGWTTDVLALSLNGDESSGGFERVSAESCNESFVN